MNVNAPCPQCGTVFTVRRELLGKRTKCTRCGTAFTIVEAAVQAPPSRARGSATVTATTGPAGATGSASAPPPPTASHIFSEIAPPPPPIPAIPQITTERPARTATAPVPGFFGEAREGAEPPFGLLRIMARGYEVLAVIVLVFALIVLLMFVIAIIKKPEPEVIFTAVFSTGLTFFWATLVAISLLAFAQAIRLALAIEENTRQTHQACRQLADHLCAIETEP